MPKTMSFRITGLDPSNFEYLHHCTEDELRAHGARRVVADTCPGFPDRVALRDAEPGEALWLVNHVHQNAETPFKASHAVYVLTSAKERYDRVDEVPTVLRSRVISLRAFDDEGMMVNADLRDGANVEEGIHDLLADPRAAYLHLHYAKFGCYACRVDRA